jgi:hypothetical protein
MSAHEGGLRQSLDELARACRILEMEGHGDMTLGHLSLRDPERRGFWLKRNRIGLGEVRGADDFVLVDWDGQQLAGSGGRHSEWPIHSEILRTRPDVQVVAHTHPFHACVFSASLDPLQPFSLDADYFVDVPRHIDQVALITTKEEAARLRNRWAGSSRCSWRTTASRSAAPPSRTRPASGSFSKRRARRNWRDRRRAFAHRCPTGPHAPSATAR